MLTFCAKSLTRNACRNQQNGCKLTRKTVPIDTFVVTVMTCHVFLKTLFGHSPNTGHGPKIKRRRGVWSLCGACCFSNFSIPSLSSNIGFRFPLLRIQMRIFVNCSLLCVCALCCDHGALILPFQFPAWIFLDKKIQCPTVDVVLRYRCEGYLKAYVMLEWILWIYPVKSSVI